MQKKYIITIPEQEYEVLAKNEEEAKRMVEDMINDCGIEMHVSADKSVSLPKAGENTEYYLKRFIQKSADNEFEGYIHSDGRYMFCDGYRVISVDENAVDITKFPVSERECDKKEAESWEQYVSEEAWGKCTRDIQMDISKVLEKASKNIKVKQIPLIINDGGVLHGINPLYLLEALYMTKNTCVRVKNKKTSPFMLRSENGDVVVCILPVTINMEDDYVVDMNV